MRQDHQKIDSEPEIPEWPNKPLKYTFYFRV